MRPCMRYIPAGYGKNHGASLTTRYRVTAKGSVTSFLAIRPKLRAGAIPTWPPVLITVSDRVPAATPEGSGMACLAAIRGVLRWISSLRNGLMCDPHQIPMASRRPDWRMGLRRQKATASVVIEPGSLGPAGDSSSSRHHPFRRLLGTASRDPLSTTGGCANKPPRPYGGIRPNRSDSYSGRTPPNQPGDLSSHAPDTTPAPRAAPGLATVVARAVTSLTGNAPAVAHRMVRAHTRSRFTWTASGVLPCLWSIVQPMRCGRPRYIDRVSSPGVKWAAEADAAIAGVKSHVYTYRNSGGSPKFD